MSQHARHAALLARLAELAAEGKTRREAADEVNYTYHRVVTLAKAAGIEFQRQPHAKRQGADASFARRAADFAYRYKSGETMQEIAESYGLSRERVRQVLALNGMDSTDGGQLVKTMKRRLAFETRRDREYLARFGCGWDEYKKLLEIGREMMAKGISCERTPSGAYRKQKYTAKVRGIEWHLTLWQWWTIWQESGRWEDRGRGNGYVMCRKGDQGAYSVDNVYIAPARHNNSHTKNKFNGLPTGVNKIKGRYVAAIQVDGVKETLGVYGTPEDAHRAYLQRLAQIVPSQRGAA